MDLDLADRVYVVGGGSRGLGRATAEALVAEGARVVLAGRDADALREAATALGAAAAEGVVADLADPAAAERLVEAALARFGGLDGALVNVGGPPAAPPQSVDDDGWRAAFESVFLGPVRLARVAAQVLRGERGNGGALCFVLSSSARSPIPGLAISNALRPGLAMHVKDLADSLGAPPRPVRVTGVLPGRVLTDRTRELTPDPADRDAIAATIPLRRYGEPAELARVATFLLSPAASYVTGSLVAVDGGATRAL